MAENRRFIEFFGLPGSGKTYISQRLCEADPATEGLNAKPMGISRGNGGKLSKSVTYARAVMRHAALALRIAGRSWRGTKTTLSIRRWQVRLLLRLFILVDRRRLAASAKGPGIWVLDQGVLQSLVSCTMTGLKFEDAEIIRILECAGYDRLECLFVLHHADLQLALDGVYGERDNVLPARARFPREELGRYFQTAIEAMNHYGAVLEKAGWRVITTWRDDDFLTNRGRIAAAL